LEGLGITPGAGIANGVVGLLARGSHERLSVDALVALLANAFRGLEIVGHASIVLETTW
jgi:hypothetical protein